MSPNSPLRHQLPPGAFLLYRYVFRSRHRFLSRRRADSDAMDPSRPVLYRIPFALCFALLLAGCSAPRAGSEEDDVTVRVPGDAREVDVEARYAQGAVTSVEDFLIGEPGVSVEGSRVRIRGSSGPPLWVIDGIETYSPFGINPADVARMWIVPTGQGYGRRGGNGVIIIQTKRG